MAERHIIIVRVRDGRVADVEFCDCCPSLTVEVRAYTSAKALEATATPVWYLGGAYGPPSSFQRDEQGVFRATFYEPEAEED